MGRGRATQIDVAGLRAGPRPGCARFKRGPARPPPAHRLLAGVRDGHESHASFRRHGAGSLTRTIHTAAGVQLGQARWAIENAGFNTLVNDGHADHVYRHEPPALLVCTLLAVLCLNVLPCCA